MPHQKINKLSETGLTCQTKMVVFMNDRPLVDVDFLLMFEIETWLTCQATVAVLIKH